MLPPDSNVVIAEPEPGALPSEPSVVQPDAENNSQELVDQIEDL